MLRPAAAVGERPPRIVFTGGRVFDVDTGTTHDADVAVEAGSIVDVATGLDGDVASEVRDLVLLPGLVDCHVHMLLSGVDLWHLAEAPLTYRFAEAVSNLRTTLAAGITTARDGGGADAGIARALRDGLLEGPRLLVAVSMLSQTGGHGDGWLPSGQTVETLFPTYPGNPDTVVDGPDDLRRVIRELARAGADHIKIATSGGVLSPTDSPNQVHYLSEELEVIRREADRTGLPVMAHAHAATAVKAAVRAGARSIEHGVWLDDEAIELMLRHGAYLVPTLAAPRSVVDDVAAGRGGSPAMRDQALEIVSAHETSFRRAVDAGVPIAFGTDAGVIEHGTNLRELVLMRDAGLAPLQCLQAATTVASDLLNLPRPAGRLVAGAVADFVGVDGDPLFLDTLADRLSVVVQGGVVKHDARGRAAVHRGDGRVDTAATP